MIVVCEVADHHNVTLYFGQVHFDDFKCFEQSSWVEGAGNKGRRISIVQCNGIEQFISQVDNMESYNFRPKELLREVKITL